MSGNRDAYGCLGTASESGSFSDARVPVRSSGTFTSTSGDSRPCHPTEVDAPGLLVNQAVSVRSIDVSPHRNPPSSHSNEEKRSPDSTYESKSSTSILSSEVRRTPLPRRSAPEVTSPEFFDYLIAIGGL